MMSEPTDLANLSSDEWGDIDQDVSRLAALDPVSFDQQRKAVAKAHSIQIKTLDKLVQAARKENGTDDDGSDDLGLFEPDLWPDKVDGAALLDDIVDDIRRYIVMSKQAAEVVALWAIHTHAFECWRHTPRLHITAPEKGCGKSTLLDVLACLVPNAIKTENLSTAVLFRVVDKYGPSLLIEVVREN